MKKLKIMSVVGTRPEIIRLSRVLAALDEHCDHLLVHTGQNYDYELNQVFFYDLGVRKPDFFLNCAEGSTSAAHTIGNLITAVDGVRAWRRTHTFYLAHECHNTISDTREDAMEILNIGISIVMITFLRMLGKCKQYAWWQNGGDTGNKIQNPWRRRRTLPEGV